MCGPKRKLTACFTSDFGAATNMDNESSSSDNGRKTPRGENAMATNQKSSTLLAVISVFTLGFVFSSPAVFNQKTFEKGLFASVETQVPFPASSGSHDSIFGTSGVVSSAVGSGNDVAQAVAIQGDGKIVVAGFRFEGSFNDFAVIRYEPDGSKDLTFGPNGDGMSVVSVGAGHDEAFGVAIQPDGKIVVVGQASDGVNTNFGVVRLNPNGMPDTTFDSDGRVTVDFAGNTDTARSVAIQSDGKIVVGGNALLGSNHDIALMRLNADGSLDSTFGPGAGRITRAIGSSNDYGYAVAIQPDGRILLAGYYNAATVDSVLLRYNSDGSLDSNFSGDGIANFSFSTDDVDEALAIALQPDGRIVVAGCIRGGGQLNDYLIARINTDGSLDSSFAGVGYTRIQFSAVADIALGVALQTDGKIVAAGFASNGSNNDFGITRVNTDGSLDTSFAGDGRQQTMFGSSSDSANAVAIQADGKIVAVGRAVVGSTADFGIARYGYGSNAAADDGFVVLSSSTAVRFDNAYRSGLSGSIDVDPGSAPSLQPGWSHIGPPKLVETTAMFSHAVVVRLTLPAGTDIATFNAVRVLQNQDGGWTDRTAQTPVRDFSTRSVFARVSSLGMIAAATAPMVEVSGMVITPQGSGLRNAVVTMIDPAGQARSVTTSSFGFYSFENVPSGATYTVRASSRRYRFSARMVMPSQSVSDLDFVGLE